MRGLAGTGVRDCLVGSELAGPRWGGCDFGQHNSGRSPVFATEKGSHPQGHPGLSGSFRGLHLTLFTIPHQDSGAPSYGSPVAARESGTEPPAPSLDPVPFPSLPSPRVTGGVGTAAQRLPRPPESPDGRSSSVHASHLQNASRKNARCLGVVPGSKDKAFTRDCGPS